MERNLIELDLKDQAWLNSSIASGRGICEFCGASPDRPVSLADIDRAFKLWKEDLPGSEDLEEQHIAAFGCLSGWYRSGFVSWPYKIWIGYEIKAKIPGQAARVRGVLATRRPAAYR